MQAKFSSSILLALAIATSPFPLSPSAASGVLATPSTPTTPTTPTTPSLERRGFYGGHHGGFNGGSHLGGHHVVVPSHHHHVQHVDVVHRVPIHRGGHHRGSSYGPSHHLYKRSQDDSATATLERRSPFGHNTWGGELDRHSWSNWGVNNRHHGTAMGGGHGGFGLGHASSMDYDTDMYRHYPSGHYPGVHYLKKRSEESSSAPTSPALERRGIRDFFVNIHDKIHHRHDPHHAHHNSHPHHGDVNRHHPIGPPPMIAPVVPVHHGRHSSYHRGPALVPHTTAHIDNVPVVHAQTHLDARFRRRALSIDTTSTLVASPKEDMAPKLQRRYTMGAYGPPMHHIGHIDVIHTPVHHVPVHHVPIHHVPVHHHTSHHRHGHYNTHSRFYKRSDDEGQATAELGSKSTTLGGSPTSPRPHLERRQVAPASTRFTWGNNWNTAAQNPGLLNRGINPSMVAPVHTPMISPAHNPMLGSQLGVGNHQWNFNNWSNNAHQGGFAGGAHNAGFAGGVHRGGADRDGDGMHTDRDHHVPRRTHHHHHVNRHANYHGHH